MAVEWKGAGARVGIEVHQQLLCTRKLFCACPPLKSEELPLSFTRHLRPAQSELGRVDPAALFEFTKGKSNRYLWNPESACLVDADEEPPHPLNPEALDAALIVAGTLGSHIVDEVHVMRKIVIDGSNTTGFQRTAVVGLSGKMVVDSVEVGVQSVTIEEDAARIIGENRGERQFALDRLGVPLVEVALDPISGDPEFVGRVALHLGRVLRSTGRVARGLGTIRQDLNVSTQGGKVVEVKGVQKLNLVPRVVAYEIKRQLGLSKVAVRLTGQGVKQVSCTTKDVTNLMKTTTSRALREQVEGGGVIFCITATGLGGLMGWEPFTGIRLGKEVAEVARANSLGGIVHSDEFERQGILEPEAKLLRDETGAGPTDALILVPGPRAVVEKAVIPLVERLVSATRRVPAETRAATEDGETRYMRPRPGSERMYPETDIHDIVLTARRIAGVERSLPEHWEATVDRLAKRYSLSRDLALKVYDSDILDAFESLAKDLRLDPSVIASTIIETPVRLAREGIPEGVLSESVLAEVLRAVDAGKVAKEAIPEVLRVVGGKGLTVAQAIETLGIKVADDAEIDSVIDSVMAGHAKLIDEKGVDSFSALMGEVMVRLRGRADGAKVGAVLRDKLRKTGRSV
jgi:glutamyl-tRNA(Gln) amidotransferase subunit E